MKLVLKIIGSVVLIAVCLSLLTFAGSFLWSAIPREREEPLVLTTDLFLEEEGEAAPPETVAPPTEDTLEEPDVPLEEEPEEAEPPVEEEPVEEEPEEPVENLNLEKAQAYLDSMTLEEKIWQLMITTPEDLTGQSPVTIASPWTQQALEAMPVGGICYFASNLVDAQQTKEMLELSQSYAKTPLFLAVDEEGGRVSRAGANEYMGVTHFESAAYYGENGDAGQVYDVGKTLAQQLGDLGFNLDFAPVADVVTNDKNTEIGNRAYSSDAAVAAPLVSSMVQGLQRGGMAACLKHFPGHGSTSEDSHSGKSVSNRTLQQLQETEWRTFRAGVDSEVAFVMVSHLTNENLSEHPSSLSPEVMTLLREELGFNGIIITDSLQMGAILNHYTSAQAAVMAIAAGADMLLMPNDLETAYNGILAALQDGTITEERINESVLRILETKYRFGIME